MQTIPRPDRRLLSAVPYLTRGGKCIDVGTDHAYLPIYLIKEGIVSHAMACDINRGPLESAKEHILAAGLEGRVETFLTDGLQGLSDFGADDVMIFGMGGELIIKGEAIVTITFTSGKPSRIELTYIHRPKH